MIRGNAAAAQLPPRVDAAAAQRPLHRGALAWLAMLLIMMGGCSAIDRDAANGRVGRDREGAAAVANAASAAASQRAALALGITIEAPEPLKSLLERHLDLVRLGSMARTDVDDGEWTRLIDATPSQVRDLARTEGWFAPEVTITRNPLNRPEQADSVLLKVEPGPRALIVHLTLEAEGELERGAATGDAYAQRVLAQFRDDWGLPPGRNFRNADWSNAKSAALARLRAAGYATANWTGTSARIDPATHEVQLYAVVDSGPLFRYGELQIEGLAAQDADTVGALLNARRGTPVSESLLLDFQDRLQKSNLFESISVTLDPDPAHAAEASIVARVHEAPLQSYTFGLGVSANNGPRASVEHLYRRVFGFAASARNKIEYGLKRQAWDGEISTHPTEGLYRNLVGGSVERLVSSSDIVLSQRIRLGRGYDTQRLERLNYVEAERSRRGIDQGDRTQVFGLSYNQEGVWRELDSLILPTRGYSFSGQLAIGRSRGSDAVPGWFERAYGRFTGYLPLGQSWFGQARLEVGSVFLRTNMVAPESKKFRAGGDDSVRGYGYRELGPLVDGAVGSGNVLVTTSVELARPILASLPTVWGAVFFDAGNAADSFHQLHLATGVGVGVRWRSPVGPLRVDWAWGEQARRGRIHFSVGIAF